MNTKLIRGTLPLIGFLILLGFSNCKGQTSSGQKSSEINQNNCQPVTLYDKHPSHPWNHAHGVLFIRRDEEGNEYGHDQGNPPIFEESEYLLQSPRYEKAISALNTVIENKDIISKQEPVERALFQHDMWLLYDWAVSRSKPQPKRRKKIAHLSARIMNLVALTSEQIKKLPNNYDRTVSSGRYPKHFDKDDPDKPFLPPELTQKDGPWIVLGQKSQPNAFRHTRSFQGRSTFVVFINLPGGRKKTQKWIEQANKNEDQWERRSFKTMREYYLNGSRYPKETKLVRFDSPPIPKGTKLALLRRMNVVDVQGRLQVTPITMSLEMRVFSKASDTNHSTERQNVFMFKLSRKGLLGSKHTSLKAVREDEKLITVTFRPISDPLGGNMKFKKDTSLHCHHDNSEVRSLKSFREPSSAHPPIIQPSTISQEAEKTRNWKLEKKNWKDLDRYFRTAEKND